MACSTVCNPVSKCFSEHCSFQDHSALPKALTLIPIIGPVIQLVKELSIWDRLSKINLGGGHETEIELVKLKNEYKFIGIARDVLTIIAIVVTAVLGILNPMGAFIAAALCGIAIGMSAWSANENQKAIEKIRNPQGLFHLIYIR